MRVKNWLSMCLSLFLLFMVTVCSEWTSWTAKRDHVVFWEYDRMFVICNINLPSTAKEGVIKIGREKIQLMPFKIDVWEE